MRTVQNDTMEPMELYSLGGKLESGLGHEGRVTGARRSASKHWAKAKKDESPGNGNEMST